VPCAWDEYGRCVRCPSREDGSRGDNGSPLLEPPTRIHYGGATGDTGHRLLERHELEEVTGFSLIANLTTLTTELQRNLPLWNLPLDALPPELRPPPELHDSLAAAIRNGRSASESFYVASDAHGGHGLFAMSALPAHTLLGEYVGVLSEVSSVDPRTTSKIDAYVMSYPDAGGQLQISARELGSLMRFVNHAPVSDAARNNCSCYAVLVDGVYHTVVMTTRVTAPREEFRYDYGDAYWVHRGRPA